MHMKHLLFFILFISPTTFAEDWSISLSRPSGWGYGPGLKIDSDGGLTISRGPKNKKQCQKQSIDIILAEVRDRMNQLPAEFASYAAVSFRNTCVDNQRTILDLQYESSRTRVAYSGPACSGNVVVPDSVTNLVAYLDKIIQEFEDCPIADVP